MPCNSARATEVLALLTSGRSMEHSMMMRFGVNENRLCVLLVFSRLTYPSISDMCSYDHHYRFLRWSFR
jgi:hypothetical protein